MAFFCTATILPPEGSSARVVSWVFPTIIQPFLAGTLTRARVFGASIYDNPHIPESEIRYLESLHPIGSVSRRIRLDGEWLPGLGGALAYHGFNRQLHVREQTAIAMNRPLLWSWDFNVDPLCSIIAQREGNIYSFKKELVQAPGNIPEMCQMFYDAFPRHGAEIWLYGDASGNRRTGQSGKSDYFIILQEMKSYGVPIRLRVSESNPNVPDRINAVNRLMKDEEGQVRIQVDPSCHELIADFEGVLRDGKGGILKTSNRKDPYFWRTHISDATGYMLAYEEPVRPPQTRRNAPSPPPPSYAHERS